MFEDASRRRFDLLLFWALDRFSREGMAPTVRHLERLAAYGVAFHSYTEPHLNAEDELVRNVSLAMLATFAKLERKRISARTKAGRERVRAQGKRLGRPPLPEHKRRRIEELAGTHPRFGYRRIWALLVREGWTVNQKAVRRLYRASGLKVARPRADPKPRREHGQDQNACHLRPSRGKDDV